MPPPFRKISVDQFAALLQQFPFQRRITAVHMHHTWRPNRAQYRGHDTIVGMWRFHTSPPNNWRDIAQHLSIAPDGSLWLGRNWNLPPASSGGHNGTAQAGPFMFEMIGDFDEGKDPFDGAQKEAALKVVALIQDRFRLPIGSLKFHNQMTTKTCPGSAISYARTLQEVQARRTNASNEIPGEGEESPDVETPESGMEGVELSPDDLADESGVQELVLSLLRDSLGGTARIMQETAFAELGEEQGAAAMPSFVTPSEGGEEGVFGGGPSITVEMKEWLRPYVVNLSRGRFSSGGEFATTPDDVDAIFGEHLEAAVQGKTAADPLRIVIWAHGGLVKETVGLDIAYRHTVWWRHHGIYPLYFVWETGIQESLTRLLTFQSGGEEGLFSPLVEASDWAIEQTLRIPGRGVWSDIKQSARLANEPNEGGADDVARKLAEFCARHGDKVQIHAVGHSAGSNFHSHFLPRLKALNVPAIRSLALLAPAIRMDRFKERLLPLIGSDNFIHQWTIFTMNNLRELDDNCLGAYRKSLLYLIHHVLEDERNTPLLGLEINLRADAQMKQVLGLGGASLTVPPKGEAIWSKTPPTAPLRARSASLAHGNFDDDAPTMDSLLRRVLNRDDIALSYADWRQALKAQPNAVMSAPNPSPTGEESIGRESDMPEDVAPEIGEEDYGVSFDILEAFERAAEGTADDDIFADETGATPAGRTRGLAAQPSLTIAFGANAKEESLTAFSRRVLEDIMRAAGVSRVVISSTSRSPSEQARVMYNNLEQFGVAHQKRLYGSGGDQVIDVYQAAKNQGKDRTTIRALMTQKIIAIGPTRVSRHASDPRILNVFDVAPNSVARRGAFIQAVQADRRVSKFLQPPADPGFHLEIPQPQV